MGSKQIVGMSEADRVEAIRLIEERELILERSITDGIASDPFWFYEPSGGEVTSENKVFLEKWLKSDDIPLVFQGQKDAHLSIADIIAVGGGNQGGKSSLGAVEAFIAITGEVPFALEGIYPKEKLFHKIPVSVRVIGVDYKTMLNTLIPTYQKWVPREYLKGGRWRDSWSAEQNKLTLRKKNKIYGTIEFMTNKMDVESFQGPPLDLIIYDEEPRNDIYKENLLRFTTAERLRIIFAMTPTKGLTWVKDRIFDQVEDEDGNSVETFKLPSVTNRKANLKVLNEVLKGLDTYDERRMRLLGDFISISGLVYGKLFNRKVHVIEPFNVTKNLIVYRGLDPHLVKPTVCVELAVDREENEYVLGCYSRDGDTQEIKTDLKHRASEYRLGWTMCDKSADSTIKVLGDRNIYRELKMGKDAIPALFTSEKYTGSINAGVDQIKKLLRPDDRSGKPKLYFFNTPENKLIIHAMETMERDMATNEDAKGVRDKIAESKHDSHACLRYIHQRPVRWLPEQEYIPTYEGDRYV